MNRQQRLGSLHVTQVQATHPALGVPAPGEGSRLPHQAVEQDGLSHAHVRREGGVARHQGDPAARDSAGQCSAVQQSPVGQAGGANTVAVDEDVPPQPGAPAAVPVSQDVAQGRPLLPCTV